MRRIAPMLVLALAACADGATAPDEGPNFARIHEAEGSHGGTPFMAVLTPEAEVPGPGDPNPAAGGVIVFTLNSGQEEICYKSTFSGLSAPAFAAHIHEGTEDVSGPVRVPLPGFTGTSGTVAQCVFAPRELIKAIRKNPENYYTNVHTRSTPADPAVDRPPGAIRGQLTKTQGSNVNHF